MAANNAGVAHPAASSNVTEEAFEVRMVPAGSPRMGQPSRVEVLLVAKAPYHVNQEYPLKFKLEPTAGVRFPSPVVGKDAAKLENMKATLPVEFTADSPGTKRIAGLLAFSLCTAERCLMEKRALAVHIDVK